MWELPGECPLGEPRILSQRCTWLSRAPAVRNRNEGLSPFPSLLPPDSLCLGLAALYIISLTERANRENLLLPSLGQLEDDEERLRDGRPCGG